MLCPTSGSSLPALLWSPDFAGACASRSAQSSECNRMRVLCQISGIASAVNSGGLSCFFHTLDRLDTHPDRGLLVLSRVPFCEV
jgi:hypothetical protein